MFYIKRLWHPDGGAPAGEGATGVQAADPGPQSLEDLGVPAEKAERFRQRKSKSAPKPMQPEAEAKPAQAEPQTTTSWDDFMKIPENNQRLQQMMSERVKRVGKEQTEYMQSLSPALELIANRYGIQANDDGS